VAREPITFAILGHNEAELLANAVAQAREALEPGDALLFLDAASTDGSGELAASLGAEVVDVPLGKGRAVARAIALSETPYVCLLDADIEDSDANIPLTLARALSDEPADMLVGEYTWPGRRVFHSMRTVYAPLVEALFPDSVERVGQMPYSGFRLLRTDLDFGELPPGFGVETYLNVMSAVRDWRARPVDIGAYHGPVRRKATLGREVGTVVLEVAERHGRLDPEARPAWDEWLDELATFLEEQPGANVRVEGYLERLDALSARPLPPARAA
jgi:glycosyltransferase involved in cell wall biosynthesis